MKIDYDINQGGMRASLDISGKEFIITHRIYEVEGNNAGIRFNSVVDFLEGLGFFIGVDIDQATGAWLRKIDVLPFGDSSKPESNQFIATLTYKTNPRQILKVDSTSSLNQENINVDIYGDPIEVTYNFTDDFQYEGETKSVTQGGRVIKMTPRRGVIYKIREYLDPAYPAEIYEGKVNSTIWRKGLPDTWLCTGITGFSDGSDGWFDNAYAFSYKEDGWDEKVVFTYKGKPPPNVEDTSLNPDAVKYPIIYENVNFNIIFPT